MKKHTVSRAMLGLAILSFAFGIANGVAPTSDVSAKKKTDNVSVITNIKDGSTSTTPTTTETTNSGVTNVQPVDTPVETTAEPETEVLPVAETVAPETGIFGGADEEMISASGLGLAMLVGSIFLLSGGITFAIENRR